MAPFPCATMTQIVQDDEATVFGHGSERSRPLVRSCDSGSDRHCRLHHGKTLKTPVSTRELLYVPCQR